MDQTEDKLMLLDLNKDDFIRCRAISFAIFIYLIKTPSFFLIFSCSITKMSRATYSLALSCEFFSSSFLSYSILNSHCSISGISEDTFVAFNGMLDVLLDVSGTLQYIQCYHVAVLTVLL